MKENDLHSVKGRSENYYIRKKSLESRISHFKRTLYTGITWFRTAIWKYRDSLSDL
jgi:hypothetical protein